MLFHTLPFLLFFIIYFIIHTIIPIRYRLWAIIIGGTIFYGWWNPYLIWLPHMLAFIAWAGTWWFEIEKHKHRRRGKFIATLIFLIIPLFTFKYTNFFYRDVFGPFFGWEENILNLPLPLGVSFVTFTMIAYVVDVYRGTWPLEKRYHMISAYMVFFPHLIAGPILRPHEIIPQLDRPKRALNARLKLAFTIFTMGIVKKMVFADQFSLFVDSVYNSTGTLSAFDYMLAIYGFSLQIYCDFSGYTDMAIGLAIAIGIKLPNNFRQPYKSTSIAEFWQNWHITLSHWLRDYIYIPLGGNRYGLVKQIINVMITMGIGGLWHGASWTFVIWGLLHGAFISVSHLLRKMNIKLTGDGKLWHWIKIIITFHIVSLLWILFRSPDLSTAGIILSGPFTAGLGNAPHFFSTNILLVILLGIFFLWHRFDSHAHIRFVSTHLRPAIFWPIIALLWVIAITLNTGSSAQFIYFDF